MLYSLRALALITTALLAAGGCGSSAQPSATIRDESTVTAPPQTAARLLSASQSGFTEPAELAVRERGEFAAAWATLHRGLPGNAPPEVDFSRRTVVLLALGERSSGGYSVRFDGITREEGGAVVRYTVTRPGPGCMTTQAITSPVDVVSVSRVEGAVRFERQEVVDSC